MRIALVFFLVFTSCCYCFGQKQRKAIKVTATYILKQTEYFYRLGDREIGIVVYRYNYNPGIVLISPHDDEVTAIEVSKAVLRKTGGTLIKINNNKERLITFSIRGHHYQFDPNRIFTAHGIANSLKLYGNYSETAAAKVKGFAQFILGKVPPNTKNVIALHNNHTGEYSIESYTGKGSLSHDTKAVFTDSSRHKDDFFLTTDEVFYNKIRGFRYNVVLQNNDLAKDDGSLSVYYGLKKKSYVNVEAEHGKSEEQEQMLQVAILPPKRKSNSTILYNYEIPDSVDLKNAGDLKIYFGDKQVGTLLSASYSSRSKTTFGQLEIAKTFPLLSNRDFFVTGSAATFKMDIRIDPTRPGTAIDRLKATIRVTMKK